MVLDHLGPNHLAPVLCTARMFQPRSVIDELAKRIIKVKTCRLKDLKVFYERRVPAAVTKRFFDQLRGREILCLDLSRSPGKTQIGNDQLKELVPLFPKTQELNLEGQCEQLSAWGLDVIAALPLRSLDLTRGKTLAPSKFIVLSRLSLLERLILNDCDASDDILENVQHLPLKELRLHRAGHRVTDVGLRYLSRLPLEILDLGGCEEVSDDGLIALAEIRSLRTLNLWKCNKVTAVVLAHLPITELDLSKCSRVDDDALAHWAHTPLKKVDFSYCNQVTDVGMRHLSFCPLEAVRVEWNGDLSDATPKALSKCPLKELSIGSEKVTSEGLAHLKDCPLEVLELLGARIADADLAKLPTSLHTLTLSGCMSLTDAGLAHLQRLRLRKLTLSNCPWLTDQGLAHLARLPIEDLSLLSCPRVTNNGLRSVARLPLQSLHVACRGDLNSAGLVHLKPLSLRHLELGGGLDVTSADLAVFRGMPLRFLRIENVSHIYQDDPPRILDLFPDATIEFGHY